MFSASQHEQDTPPANADQCMASLLCLLHLYAQGPHCGRCEQRLQHAIHDLLSRLSQDGSVGQASGQACRELADLWLTRLAQQQPVSAGLH